MITDEQIYEAAAASAYKAMSRDCFMKEECYTDLMMEFENGAKWAMEKQQNDLYNALKGLGLDKHAIALNVLKIAGIKLPKHKLENE